MPPVDRRLLVVAAAVVLVVVAVLVSRVGGSAGSGDPTAVAVTAVPDEPPLVVHVTGAVRRPGLYRIARGSRVADAIESAGGLARRAEPDAINLATPLVDGQQVRVPERAPAASAAAASAGASTGPVALSSADAATLETLPGIGPATAAKIIAWREANGGFAEVDDLLRVPGIGPAKLEALRPLVAP